jgi:hypothetical protein
MGHVLFSLRVSFAFISIAVITVVIALVFLLLVRLLPKKNLSGRRLTEWLRVNVFWIYTVHPKFDHLSCLAVSICYEAVAGCGSVFGDSAAFSSSRKADIVRAL